jgi:DNA polymerase-3 subunit epsilon
LFDSELAKELPSWARKLAVFDLETTGLELATARIVTACVAVINAQGEIEQLDEWLVNPGIEIPASATSVHGISTEKAFSEGREAAGAIPEIVSTLKQLNQTVPIVVFNAPYDFTILKHEATRYQVEALAPAPVIDPLVIDRKLRFAPGKRNLSVLCEIYGVVLSDAHNSTADAVAAGRLAQKLALKYPELAQEPSTLHELQTKWSQAWTKNFHDWLEKENRPVDRAEIGWPIRAS